MRVCVVSVSVSVLRFSNTAIQKLHTHSHSHTLYICLWSTHFRLKTSENANFSGDRSTHHSHVLDGSFYGNYSAEKLKCTHHQEENSRETIDARTYEFHPFGHRKFPSLSILWRSHLESTWNCIFGWWRLLLFRFLLHLHCFSGAAPFNFGFGSGFVIVVEFFLDSFGAFDYTTIIASASIAVAAAVIIIITTTKWGNQMAAALKLWKTNKNERNVVELTKKELYTICHVRHS